MITGSAAPALPSFLPFYFRVCAFSIQRTRLSRSLEQPSIIEDEFHFFLHCSKYSMPRKKVYNQIQHNFVDFNQLSTLMNSQNFFVNSNLLKFVSLCNDLRNNLPSNHTNDSWLTIVIIVLCYHWYKL